MPEGWISVIIFIAVLFLLYQLEQIHLLRKQVDEMKEKYQEKFDEAERKWSQQFCFLLDEHIKYTKRMSELTKQVESLAENQEDYIERLNDISEKVDKLIEIQEEKEREAKIEELALERREQAREQARKLELPESVGVLFGRAYNKRNDNQQEEYIEKEDS